MKKLLFVFATLALSLVAAAQPMGGPPMGGPMGGPMMGMGMDGTKPFYQLESDSIAAVRLAVLNLDEKQAKKAQKLVAQEYEDICRTMQMAVMDFQMAQEFAGMGNRMGESVEEATLDKAAIRKSTEDAIAKYAKKLSKIFDATQAETWAKLENEYLEKEFDKLLDKVQENTDF